MTSACLRRLVLTLMQLRSGFASISHFTLGAHPVHSMGSPPLPRPLITHNDVFWRRNFIPACHRLRLLRPRLRTRLTLGRLTLPRNPQAFGVRGSYTQYATHSGILTSRCSTSPHGLASTLENAPLPCSSPHYNVRRLNIHSFGSMLEPRYVVGATSLDQ